MKMKVVGSPDRPVALFVHPALQDAAFFNPLIAALHGTFRVALPTLDGHYPGAPDFDDARTQATRLAFHLHAEHIDHIDLVLGCGLGAVVALMLLSNKPALLKGKAVLEGATFNRGALRARALAKQMSKLASKARISSEKARRLVDSRDAQLVDNQVYVASFVSLTTIDALAATSYKGELPPVPASLEGRLTFLWGGYDQQGSAHSQVARAYPRARVEVLRGWGTMGLLRADPEGYARAYLL